VWNERILMKKSMIGASLMLGALLLTGCDKPDNRTTCFGVEPDGEVEKLKPCPPGWKANETRNIGEDEFWVYEVNEPGVNKKNKGTGSVKVKPTK
jgi:hypothetical protein